MNHAPSRPLAVSLLTLGVLIMAVLHAARLVLSIRQAPLIFAQVGIAPAYLALTGLIWCLAGLRSAWGLYCRRSWVPGFTRSLAVAYAVYFWLDRLLIVRPNEAKPAWMLQIPPNWMFLVLTTIILLALVFGILAHKKIALYLGESNE